MSEPFATLPTDADVDWNAITSVLQVQQQGPTVPASDAASLPRLGLARLLGDAVRGRDIMVHTAPLLQRARNQHDANAMLDLSLLLQLKFQRSLALALQRAALAQTQVYAGRAQTPGALKLLVIKAPGDLMTNTPIECLLERQGVEVTDLYLDIGLPWPEILPAHDLVFVAISVSDRHRALLMRMSGYLRDRTTGVLNAPDLIQNLSRDRAFHMVRDIDSVRMAETRRLRCSELRAILPSGETEVSGLPFPLIIRPVDSHAGTNLERLDGVGALADYLERVDAAEYFVGEFIDYASADGCYRKLRVVLIGGVPYVCHLGISTHWMVHYPYAEMLAHPERRAEEAALLGGAPSAFVERHAAAFAALYARFGLDYLGMDCAETPDGRLLIFEFANALVVHDFDDPQAFPYKSPQMQKTFSAFGRFLRQRAGE